MIRLICWILCILPITSVMAAGLHSEVRSDTFDNGITYYVWPQGPGTRATVSLVVPVGSVHEGPHERGLAHLLEHLMFRGSASFSQSAILDFLRSINAAIGPDVNAFTSFDRTVYEFEIPADNLPAIETALKIIRGWISEAALTHRDIEEERSIVLEEWRARLGQGAQVHEKAIELIFAGSKYADRIPIGLPEVIRHASPETIRQFYRRWYLLAPVAVIVAGPVDGDAVESMIQQQFQPLDHHRSWTHVPNIPVVQTEGLNAVTLCHSHQQETTVQLVMNQPIWPCDAGALLKQELIQQLYYSIFHNRVSKLPRGSILSDATCYPFSFSHNSKTHVIEVGCDADAVDKTIRGLSKDLRHVLAPPVTHEELFDAKSLVLYAMGASIEESDYPQPRALVQLCLEHFLTQSLLFDTQPDDQDRQADFDPVQIFETLDVADIQAFSDSLNRAHNGLLLVMSRCSVEQDAYSVTSPDLIRAWEEGMQEEVKFADLPFLSDSPLMNRPPVRGDNLGLLSWKLENGLCIHLLRRTHRGPVALWGFARGGLADLEPAELLAGRMAAAALEQSGVGPYDAAELSRFLSHRDVELHRSIHPLSRYLTGSCSSSEMETLFQLIHLAFVHQQVTPFAFEKVRGEWVQDLNLEHQRSRTALTAQSLALTTGHHPLFVSPTVEQLYAATFEDTERVALEAFSNPTDFDLFFVGDVNPEIFCDLATSYLATIPSRGPRKEARNKLEMAFPEHVIVDGIVMGHDPESQIEFIFPVAIEPSSPRALATAQIAKDLVAGRIHELIRNRLSATYHVSALLDFIYPDLTSGRLVIHFSCLPEDADVLGAVTLRELRKLKEQGPFEDELRLLKQQAIRRLHEDQESNSFWSRQCGRYTQLGWDPRELMHMERVLSNLDLEDVHTSLKEMLLLDRYALMMSFPEINS